MVEGPEVNPLLAAYEAMSSSIDTRIDSRHDEATVGAQTDLFENVKVMTGSFRVKSPKITENLNPTDSDFNQSWYT